MGDRVSLESRRDNDKQRKQRIQVVLLCRLEKRKTKLSKENRTVGELVEPEHGGNAKTEVRHTNDHGLRGRALSDDDEMLVVAAVKEACKTTQKLNE